MVGGKGRPRGDAPHIRSRFRLHRRQGLSAGRAGTVHCGLRPDSRQRSRAQPPARSPQAPRVSSGQLPEPVCSGLISAEIVLLTGSKPSWLNTTVYAP